MGLREYYTPIVTARVVLTDSLNPPTGLRPRLTSAPPESGTPTPEFRPVVGRGDLSRRCFQGCREVGEGVCLDVVCKPRLACPTPKLISFSSPHVCPQGEGRAPN